jgi:ribose transport system ATP-binding protein
VVFVSHRLGEVLEICGRIYVLKDGRLVAETHADTTNESDLHEFMVGRVRDSDYYAEHRQTRDRSTKVVMEVQALTKRDVLRAHGSEGRRFAVENVSLSLHEGEILGVGGLVGSGKSILARCLAGVERLESGEMKVEGKVVRQPSARRMKLLGVAYLPPDRRIEGAVMSFPVSWNISLPSGERGSMGFATLGGFWRKTFERREAYRLINAFRIKAGPQNQTQTLSGGNQQKVVLAKWIRRNPRILIMDNPTSGIDVGARMEIYAILRDLATGGAGIVLVSDDLSELIALSDRVAVMRNGRLARVFDTPDGDKPSEAALVSMMTAGQEGGAQAGEQKLEHHA